ncbi:MULTISPECIES: LysM peptidoglycan-binding domain-containing protein [unclassified Mesorhizobium]|uniref:LysM peptidoglycan-binding domain-containing protein n=1 Tax=unclassified Mesorhizobium TaxID=325217 RepID=UPI002415E2B3|nr:MULTISPECIES: LysM peptidoglycan-binding domain-containing protein [unclassified Mesorhizobium]WFP65767.1 LysM peptidoglycan-binding domain-containing protein [Mesorhizobium sp. WSM4904]WFP79029.1 LysM peptidoglycan-binding domain-containing protein [Mesorhizobium sp. WSM4906]
MVRPITLAKPPLQTQKVNANADAAQVARLEVQAAALRDQIRLANRMGERDWAAQARQELAQVNTQLSSLQPSPATAPAAPGVNVANASNGTSGNGTTVTPALYVNTNPATPAVTLVDLNGSPAKDNPAAANTARDIVNDVTGGKSIEQIASDRHLTREQVIAALRSGGMIVSDSSAPNGDTQTTKITDASGRTVTQFYDYQHDSYYATVQEQPGGATTTSPIRDGLGRKETTSYNSDTGAITTRYEDDLGTGTVTERTSLPDGASVETVTPGAGPSLPMTTVTGPDGRKTILAPSQDPGGSTTQDINHDLADGKSIDQIAKENGLTNEQVIGELQAAGYKVTTNNSSDAQSVELADPRTGGKTVYSYDYQHDVRTVTTTADGKKTSLSVDGNGTETKTVTDKDGRVTTTTTKKINGGKPVVYEVQPDDNLTQIARQYGVTLADLRRTNPELFSSSRDPNTIHTGEKITIDNGTRTTVEVTFNGYTLTTKPDGSMTLHNNTTGADLKIEAGSTQEALARTLLAVNPNSSDPKEAKEGEVVKTFVEGILAGEALPGLIDAAEKAGQDKQALIDKYHLGMPAKPKLDGQNRVVDPFGDPPQGNAPSGGKWMPMKIDGVWTWVDPQVAQAIIDENIALSRVTEMRALAVQGQEQLNVDMLDPAYKDAVGGAQTILNKALAPHGLQWNAQKPKGTLADARERVTKANTLLKNAQDARGEYENAGRVLKDAIAGQGPLTPLGDPNAPSVSARGTPDLHPQRDQSVADHSAVDKLFSEVGLHLSKGDKLTIDFLVGQADLNGVPKDSKEYKELTTLQTTAGSQLELAQAYQDYFDAHANATQVSARQTDLEQKLSNEYLGEQKFNFDEKYNRISGDYLGHYKNSTLEIRDGQLWVINHFDEGTTEQQLTYSLSDKNVRDEYRDRQLNKDWQALLAGYGSNAKVCTANGLQSVRSSEEQAAKSLNDVLDRQLGNSLADLNAKLPMLQTNFDNALTHHKPGSVDAPEGTLPNGAQPVEIKVGGQTIKVAPDVAQNYEQNGIDALTQGGKAIWIDLDTEDDDKSGRWVDPGLAVAKLRLEATKLQISQIGDLRRQLQGFNDYHELRLSEPSLLADDNTSVDKTYLDEHEQLTLDAMYQPRFQQLLKKGYDNEFREQRGTDLDEMVARKLGLDSSTDDGRDAIENVTDEIRDIGGDNPYVRSVPIFYVDDQVGTQQVTLFAVRDGDGNTRYVDATGKKFDDLGDFQDNNSQFGENGKLVVPKDLEMKAGPDGKIALDVVKARNVSVWDKVVDPLVGIGTGIATILSFTPAAPVAAPLAYTGAAYLGTRAVINEVNHLDHGGEWYDTESLTNIASAATTVLPMASSGLRTIGMAAKSESFLAGVAASPRAFAGSIGATRSNWALASETRTYMQSTARLNKAAWGMDVGSVVVGSPLLATSAYDLAANRDQMNGLQLANALTGLGTGITGTGLGIHGLRTMRPGTGTQDPNAPGADANPPGSDGPFQQPPGGKRPSQLALEPGPSGRPMNVYEIGADGVYRPTGEQVFHDPSLPVIPGEVIKTDDVGGNGATAAPVRDPEGSTASGIPHPADGDPIVVPGEPTVKEGPVRLVWDPQTRSFTGMPDRDTSGYVYTSGKDPKTPSAYLDGLSAEQLMSRYEQEKGYYSSREMAERYGPDGVQIPRTPLRETLPDFRVGVTVRVRLNTGQAFGIGSPTVAAVGFGVGTKTDFGMIGWSILDSVGQRSLTPFKDALGTQGVVSFRAREYRNITSLQAGVWPVSNQTAFPVRSSDLSAAASKAIFHDASGYEAKPVDAAIVGMTPDGKGTVIEMIYTPSLSGKEVSLAPGQHDFFGVPAENSSGHVVLQGTLPFDRVMTETKAGIRLPIVANHVAAVDQMPRIGFEKRPELPVTDTLRPGDVVSAQAFDQIQSALGATKLKVQFAVNDPAKGSELITAIGQGDGIRSIRDLVKSGQIDPSNTVSLVDEPTQSGLRLSAIPGKSPTADIVLLTGEKARVVNPEAMLVDVIFNDSNRLPGALGFNPDRMVTSATYKVKSTVQSWIPARFRPEGSPQSRYMPSAGNIYRKLYGSDGTPATRYTLSMSTPPLPAGAVAYSAEVRFQYKSKAAKTAPSIAKGEDATLTFDRANGQSETLTVPAWLAHAVQPSGDGAAKGVPKGGRASLEKFLGELEKTARPDQRAAIEQFRTEFGPSIVDGGFIRQDVADGVLTFLSSQVGSRRSGPIQIRDENGQSVTATRYGPLPKSAENVYVPPADGPQARGDEPELMHKSHILFRDPDTGEAYVLPWTRGASEDHVPGGQATPTGEAAPAHAPRKAIEAAPPTTYSLQQIRNMRQPEKWKAGETYTRELNRSLGEAHFPVEANPDGPHPVTGQGGRYVDAPVFKSQDVIEAIEVKTYHRWTTINGVAQMREVPLTPKLQEQINKDVALRNENSGYQPRWVFLDAPPSAELQGALDDAGIVGNIFGHNKPAATTPPPQPAAVRSGSGRAIQLEDESGEVITAAVLGTGPRSPEQVHVPPSDSTHVWGDAPEMADKTHILVYDPDTGEAVVLPWIRGASDGHVPGSLGRPEENNQQANAAAQPLRGKGQSASNSRPLTRDGVRATPLDQVPDLVMGDFQPTQVPWLKREQVAELTEQQFGDMDKAGLLPYLTKSQLRGIPKAKTGFVNIASLGEKQIPWLTEGQIRNATDQQFQDLGKASLTSHLTKPQLQAIKGDKVQFVDMSTLGARQVPWFRPGQVAKFTSPQFKDLAKAGLLKHVTERQVRAIPEPMVGSVDVAKLDPRQVPWLTEKQIPVLTRDQWGAFTIHHTEAFIQPQIEAATPNQFGETSPGQFRKFTPEQFEWMSGDQKNALSVLQLTTFRATHKKAMMPDQAASVDLALSHARMRENAQALATFGGMSTTSYVLWSSLPPTWTATAGAVAFGVRGFVFGAQAVFPNATANHKPFGRFLNALGGATFIAAAPGAATGMVQGKGIVVNSTFSLGNVVYGTKSMLQSFTGRPVIRNLAEYLAGPGYVLGCAVYTLHSWPAPIATVAGTMFTFGCAEFWASAIRTDRTNRRSVPRTDADIAAAAKSDKRWATVDRWTLGITFGIGMLLFSLDSMLAQPWDPKTTAPPNPKKPDGDTSSPQPDNHSDVPGKPKTPPEDFPQLVVSADDGLNLRSQPEDDSAVVTVLQPGTFVEQTAKPSTDPSGEAWIPVEGFGPDGKKHSGWVSGDYVEVHPAGSSNSEGRTNPTLEKDGYRWVEVRDGDSIRLIANAHSADVADTVVLNMDHILSPDMIFSGDRIYLPIASVG